MHILKLFLLILPPFLVMDLLWLGVVMKDFYAHELGDLARREGPALAPRWSRRNIRLFAHSCRDRALRAAVRGSKRYRQSIVRLGRLVWPGALWRLRPHESGCTGEMDFARDPGRHRLGLLCYVEQLPS